MPNIPSSCSPAAAPPRNGTRHAHRQVRCAAPIGPAGIYIEINPADARRLGIESGDEVRVISRQAEIVARAFVTPTVAAGQVFMPMHYEAVNQLLAKVFDLHSRQPSYKVPPVRARAIFKSRVPVACRW